MPSGHSRSQSASSLRPSISYPIPVDPYQIVQTSPSKHVAPKPASPPPVATNSIRHRPSLSASMAKSIFSRSSTSSSSSVPYAPSKPVRISEPKLTSAFDAFTRRGTLGSGAIVVRTPQEALAGSNVSVHSQEDNVHEIPITLETSISPTSPPLPPIPDDEDEVEEQDDTVQFGVIEMGNILEAEPPIVVHEPEMSVVPPPKPTRAVPPTPVQAFEEFNPKSVPKNSSPSSSMYFPHVPSSIPSPPAQSSFDAIVITPFPTLPSLDLSKVIVSLETSTLTYRTTFKTLTSRPSQLASYIESLVPPADKDEDDDAPLRTPSSEAESSAFNSIFRNHLASSGLLQPSSSAINVHIFLDRPSAPYAHILTYLRSPPSTADRPSVLPRAAHLNSSSSSRLEALLELRDEARYLGLEELYRLCTDEIRLRNTPANALGLSSYSSHHMHSHSQPVNHYRALNSMSVMSATTPSASTRSLGTLQEEEYVPDDEKSDEEHRRSQDSGIASSSPHSKHRSPRHSSEGDDTSSLYSNPSVIPSTPNPGLQQRMTMLRGRSNSRNDGKPRPTGDWI
ncbi:hypothetical protein C8Q75DRAFT_741966 [Abortiporus biennis]|nr:hypothetical protein C8Q75DRAFT_741966 [Abortiporus biennis]